MLNGIDDGSGDGSTSDCTDQAGGILQTLAANTSINIGTPPTIPTPSPGILALPAPIVTAGAPNQPIPAIWLVGGAVALILLVLVVK